MREFDNGAQVLVTLTAKVNETVHIITVLVNGELAALSIVDDIERGAWKLIELRNTRQMFSKIVLTGQCGNTFGNTWLVRFTRDLIMTVNLEISLLLLLTLEALAAQARMVEIFIVGWFVL